MVVPKGVFNLALVRYSPSIIDLVVTEKVLTGRRPAADPATDAEDFNARH
jgi:hypothetical protein